MCLPVHKKFKNPCFISILHKLQTFVYVMVTKEFMTVFSFDECVFLLDPINPHGLFF